jgi:hypothetical protein
MATIKALWHKRSEAHLSLKQFAHKLLESDGEHKVLAQDWFARKGGILEKLAKEDRIKRKGGQLAEIRIKVRASRRNGSSTTSKPETAKKDKGKKGQAPAVTQVKKN